MSVSLGDSMDAVYIHGHNGSMTITLIDFVQARIDDEEAAVAPYFDRETGKLLPSTATASPGGWNAERVVDELNAIQEIIWRAERCRPPQKTHSREAEYIGLMFALRAIAILYRTHPDWRGEWV